MPPGLLSPLPALLQLSLALYCVNLAFSPQRKPQGNIIPPAETWADACGSPLWVGCWWHLLSWLLQCVGTASPVGVTNPRLDIQDASPSLWELCQLDTRPFFLLKL